MSPVFASGPQLWAVTFLVSLLGGLVPFVNVEAYLISVSALSPGLAPLGVVLAAALGQMAAKSVLYLAGRGFVRLPLGRHQARVDHATARLAHGDWKATVLLFISASTGLPPFYVVSIAAGFVRFPLGAFLGLGLIGRFLRFGVVFLLPTLF